MSSKSLPIKWWRDLHEECRLDAMKTWRLIVQVTPVTPEASEYIIVLLHQNGDQTFMHRDAEQVKQMMADWERVCWHRAYEALMTEPEVLCAQRADSQCWCDGSCVTERERIIAAPFTIFSTRMP